MKAVITGATGTVGQALVNHLTLLGWSVVPWERQHVPIDDFGQMDAFIRRESPDVLFHLATASQPTGRNNESWLVNYEWTSELAWLCKVLSVRFVFTSSVMVFTDDAKGPFTIHSRPDASSGYGHEKLMAEKRVLYQNDQAIVGRIGWQIGETSGGNHMLEFLLRQAETEGQINASTHWYPACSFLSDTAAMLTSISHLDGGLYLIDSNIGWTFYEIVTAIKKQNGYDWPITPTTDFVYDQRMVDLRIGTPSLATRLPALGKPLRDEHD